MPILIAIGIAALVVTVVLTLVTWRGRPSDPTDVREGAAVGSFIVVEGVPVQ